MGRLYLTKIDRVRPSPRPLRLDPVHLCNLHGSVCRPAAAEILQRPIVQSEIRRMLLEEQAVRCSLASLSDLLLVWKHKANLIHYS